MASWKYYRAKAEQFRGYNVFPGPLDAEAGEVFIHYVRQGELGDGTDFFGIYCEDHAAWLKAQPQDLGLKEISAKGVPVPNVYTELRDVKLAARMAVEGIGLGEDDEFHEFNQANGADVI